MKLHLYYLANEEILYIYYTYYRALVEMNNLLFIHFFSIFSGTMLMLVIIALHSTAQITKKSFLDSSEVSVTTNLVLVIMITLISKPWRSRLKKELHYCLQIEVLRLNARSKSMLWCWYRMRFLIKMGEKTKTWK